MHDLPTRPGARQPLRTSAIPAAQLLLCCTLACAELIDLPSDPRLVEDAGVPERSGVISDAVPGRESPDAAQPAPREPLPQGSAAMLPGAAPSGSGPLAPEPEAPEPDPSGENAPEAEGATPFASDAGAPAPPEPSVEESPDPAPDEAAPSGPCTVTESEGPNGRCYLVLEATLSWEEARAACQGRGDGWDLAAVRDEATHLFMAELVDAEAWIGGSDAELEGTWRWVSDGEPFWRGDGTSGSAENGAFERWNSDEPNGGGNSDCVRLVVREGAPLTWADLECFEPRASVCEGPPL